MTPADFRAARASTGMTQKALAAALKMGAHGWQTISRWESDSFEGTIPGPVQVAMDHLINCPVRPDLANHPLANRPSQPEKSK